MNTTPENHPAREDSPAFWGRLLCYVLIGAMLGGLGYLVCAYQWEIQRW